MSMIAVFLVKMYLGTGIDPCQLQRIALADFEASGLCTWDPETEDGECTEDADAVLSAMFNACSGNFAEED